MSQKSSRNLIGILGFVVVALIIAVIVIATQKDSNINNFDEYRVDDNQLAIENAHDYNYHTYEVNLEDVSVAAENSPAGPEAGY